MALHLQVIFLHKIYNRHHFYFHFIMQSNTPSPPHKFTGSSSVLTYLSPGLLYPPLNLEKGTGDPPLVSPDSLGPGFELSSVRWKPQQTAEGQLRAPKVFPPCSLTARCFVLGNYNFKSVLPLLTRLKSTVLLHLPLVGSC